MKKILIRILPPFILESLKKGRKLFSSKYRKSYAQCGEDIMIDVILGKEKGFYLDIGANNPFEQSNTMYFYKKGWCGINIDATPGSMVLFNKYRKRDINLEVAVSSRETEMTYYLFEPSFHNSFEKKYSEEFKEKLVGQIKINTVQLSKILEKNLGENEIDFLTVDAEGYDYDILMSNDWSKYRPKIVLTEYITYYESEIEHCEKIRNFLEGHGYLFFCNSPTNAIFIEKDFYKKRFNK
jgi:FkbM family methyltransferase